MRSFFLGFSSFLRLVRTFRGPKFLGGQFRMCFEKIFIFVNFWSFLAILERGFYSIGVKIGQNGPKYTENTQKQLKMAQNHKNSVFEGMLPV